MFCSQHLKCPSAKRISKAIFGAILKRESDAMICDELAVVRSTDTLKPQHARHHSFVIRNGCIMILEHFACVPPLDDCFNFVDLELVKGAFRLPSCFVLADRFLSRKLDFPGMLLVFTLECMARRRRKQHTASKP